MKCVILRDTGKYVGSFDTVVDALEWIDANVPNPASAKVCQLLEPIVAELIDEAPQAVS